MPMSGAVCAFAAGRDPGEGEIIGRVFGLQERLAALAASHAVPAFYPLTDYVVAGGLIRYGANLSQSLRGRWRQ